MEKEELTAKLSIEMARVSELELLLSETKEQHKRTMDLQLEIDRKSFKSADFRQPSLAQLPKASARLQGGGSVYKSICQEETRRLNSKSQL